MSTTTTTGTLAAGSSKTFTLAPGAAVSLTLSPNPRVTITETPESIAGSGVGGNTTRVHEPQLPGTFAYGPYAMGGVVVVAVASNSGSSVAWTRKDTVVTTSSDGTSLVSGDGLLGTLRTSPNYVALLGDSRTASNRALNAGVNLAAWNASGVFSALRARSGQRLRMVYNGGVAGDRTDEINVRLETALAYFPGLVIYWGGLNDIAEQYPSASTSGATAFANIRTAGLRAISTGAVFLVFTEYPATGWSAAQVSQLFELNARLSNWAQNTPGVVLFDVCRYMLDYTTATAPTRKTGYTYDGVHPSMKGAYILAKALDAQISSTIPNLGPKRVSGLQDAFSNNPWELLANGNHITTSGGAGSGSGGVTGTVPSGMNITRSGSTVATVVSTAACADGVSGNDAIFTMTNAAVNDVVQIRHLPTLGDFVLGGTYQAMCDIDVSGTAGLDSVRLSLEYEHSATAYLTIDQNFATGERPGIPDSETFSQTLLTDPITIPTGITLSAVRWFVQVKFGVIAGAAVVKVRNCSLRRIPD